MKRAFLRRIAGVQRCDHVDFGWQLGAVRGVGRAHVEKGHAPKPQPGSKLARLLDQFGARLDAVDMTPRAALEKQVVQDEPQVRLARAVVGQRRTRRRRGLGFELQQQLLDELVQVIDLFELAPGILIELAVAGQDVQFLEQLQRLAGPDVRIRLHGHRRTLLLTRGSGFHWPGPTSSAAQPAAPSVLSVSRLVP
jgi:hypothetical protein